MARLSWEKIVILIASIVTILIIVSAIYIALQVIEIK